MIKFELYDSHILPPRLIIYSPITDRKSLIILSLSLIIEMIILTIIMTVNNPDWWKFPSLERRRILRNNHPTPGKIVDKKWKRQAQVCEQAPYKYRFLVSYQFGGKAFEAVPGPWLSVPGHVAHEFLQNTYPYVTLLVDPKHPKKFLISEYVEFEAAQRSKANPATLKLPDSQPPDS